MASSHSAIKVESLGKEYIINHASRRVDTFADAMSAMVHAPVQWLKRKATKHTRESFWALRDVSFEIAEGEVVGVIGRNGAGKSTLLKILSRITEPTTGRVAIRGRVASLLEVGTGFHPELTGRENIVLNGAILGMTRTEIKRKFDEIVEFAGTGKFLDTPVKRYSSGMYVRLAFAVAAHLDSEVLIVDEVLAVGDAEFQRRCLKRMRDAAKNGRTVLFVSHNMRAVVDLCGRAVLLEKGRIVGEGATSRVVNEYLSRGLGEKSSWQPQPAGRAPFVFHGVVVRSEDETVSQAIPYEQPVEVLLDYSVTDVIDPNRIAIAVSNEMGDLIFTSAETDSSTALNHRWSLGRYRSRCIIPSRLLAPGRYFLSVSQPDHGGTSQVHESVLSFDITDQGSPSARDGRGGIIVPTLQWRREPAVA